MVNGNRTIKSVGTLARTNSLYGLLLIVIGIVFIAIPHVIAKGLPFVLFAVILFHAVLMFYYFIKSHIRLEKIIFILNAIISVALCVLLVVFRERKEDVVALLVAIYMAMDIIAYIFGIIKNTRQKRILIGKIFMLLIYLILFVAILRELGNIVSTHIAIYGTIFLVQGLAGVYSNLKQTMNGNTLFQIISKSYAGEILAGLLIVVVGASILLPVYEPSITTFGDGLWYSFMLVTTIGFGDMTAVTHIGRLISVIVGIYGIVVVALVTSILVNLYNENKSKDKMSSSDNQGE